MSMLLQNIVDTDIHWVRFHVGELNYLPGMDFSTIYVIS